MEMQRRAFAQAVVDVSMYQYDVGIAQASDMRDAGPEGLCFLIGKYVARLLFDKSLDGPIEVWVFGIDIDAFFVPDSAFPFCSAAGAIDPTRRAVKLFASLGARRCSRLPFTVTEHALVEAASVVGVFDFTPLVYCHVAVNIRLARALPDGFLFAR